MPETKSTEQQSAAAETRRPHVLVVEDNRDLAKLFCDLLEIVGCSTDIATTVSAGLEQAKRRTPELVFCDLALPGDKSGFEFPTEFRKLGMPSQIRLIAVTGYSSPEDHARAMEAGFERVMTKPVKFAEMQTVVRSIRLVA
ncbi:response regulator [Noviherbaspirillum galbum]|uniref:Response regulator n=1 Tax=Noviherbaspirillum galbum TaxID=2709383 RepID=A0A6B3SXU0_9BURK|nr:response regulator [Noviherbaspirillum galbum]NEX64006.1 response regulator [Noviherbaspirillum galbum]